MKRIILTATVALLAALPLRAQGNRTATDTQKNMKNDTSGWHAADSLMELDLPSAEKIINEIYDEARREQNVPQFIRAVIYRLRTKYYREEEAHVKSIAETEALLQTAAFPAKNILHSIAAELYRQYCGENRWTFRNRTAQAASDDTGLPPDGDIRTLDLRQLVNRCMAHYAASLEMPRELQEIPIGAYSAMLEKAVGSERYRPTLFDFLAFRAVEFYRTDEAGLAQPADRFVVDRAEYFLPAAAFVQLPLATADTLSFSRRSLLLLQKIMAFHLADTVPDALTDADLQRLDFVHRQCVLPGRDSLYLSALQALEAKLSGAPCSAEAAYRTAALYSRQGDAYDPFTSAGMQWKKKEAIAVIDRAVAQFPGSPGAAGCLALKNDILHAGLTIETDRAVVPGKPFLAGVTYRNVPKIHVKIVPLDFKKELAERYESSDHRLAAYAAMEAACTAAFELPDDGDYQQHVTELALPALKEGYYALLASADGHFSQKATLLTETKIWATNIGYAKANDNGQAVVQVFDRTTGEPAGGVRAQLYFHEYSHARRRYEPEYGETFTSGADGRIEIKAAEEQRRSQSLLFTKGTDSYAADGIYLYRHSDDDGGYMQTAFFTDRAIYRPGQTVFFKGVVLKWRNGKAETAAGYRQTVTFYNAGSEKVSELDVSASEFGSFAGSFAVPAGGLTGKMRLEAAGASGAAWFDVEEYRRPAFEVTFDDAGDAARRPGEQVTVAGKASAYAGSAVSDATVTWRVTREARYPLWQWWRGAAPSSPAQEIANGETVTDAAGAFGISFTAIPDDRADRAQSPVFHYAVHAAVRDVNGETHEAGTTVPVGYRTLLLSADTGENVNLDTYGEIAVAATGLQGNSVPAKGTLAVWKLHGPGRVLQPRRGQRPDRFALTRAEFERLFPHSVYDSEDRPEHWARTPVFSTAFDTDSAAKYALPGVRQWAEGKYMVTLSAKDAYGETVADTAVFTGFRTGSRKMPAKEPGWMEISNPAAQPGDTLHITAGSAFEDVQAWMEITGRNGAVMEQRLLRFSNSKQRLEIPVTEAHRGGFGVSLRFVRHNRAYTYSQTIQVPFDNKKLQLEFASFRDRLQPGRQEEWRITVKNHAGDAVAAELLASMYDASLDAFAAHRWQFFPWHDSRIAFRWNTEAAFRPARSETLIQDASRTTYPAQREYDRLLAWNRTSAALFSDYAAAPAMLRGGAEKMTAAALRKDALPEAREQNTAAAAVREDEKPAMPDVPRRTNFNETAFFYPQLRTNEHGETVIAFTVPESLTRWKMQGLAWTRDLLTGSVQKDIVTQKDLMIFPNAPRFLRENDTLYFAAKLSNRSGRQLDVTAQLRFFDARTMHEIPLLAAGETATKTLSLAAAGNRALSWKLHIPEGLEAVTCRITAAAAAENGMQTSDGEENTLPVLANRTPVTESLALPVRGTQPKQFEFTKLLRAASPTLRHHAYTVEFTGQPVWYAIRALPYVMEAPTECAEQTFGRYCANAIAAHIAGSDPEIRRVFDLWRSLQPAALQSNLEKNEALKSILLEETPWVRDARTETEQMHRMALLFDRNHMRDAQDAALRKIRQAQTPNGGFAWFPGGRDDRYITQLIVAGIGRLRKMNIPAGDAETLLAKAIAYMDDRMREEFDQATRDMRHATRDSSQIASRKSQIANHISPIAIHYLYARSFFVDAYPVPEAAREAFDCFRTQAAAHWTQYNNCLKGMIALALHRLGDAGTPRRILQSLAGTALRDDESGMHWRSEPGWWWYQAPVETQALMIEAFTEITGDRDAAAALQTWLLRQKQTQHWPTTRATADAIYALLLDGARCTNGARCTVHGTRCDKRTMASAAVNREPSTVHRAPSAVNREPSTVHREPSPVHREPSAVNREPSAVNREPSTVHREPSPVHREPFQITVGDSLITPPAGTEAGTGYFTASWHGAEVTPAMARITVTPPPGNAERPAWGAAYWQYFEQTDKIAPAATGVRISRRRYRKTRTAAGDVLHEITPEQPLRIGDRVTVRLEIRADRDMEYVHLKDARAAAFEPVSTLSGYRRQDGLDCYEAPRDAATNFFIPYLPKGTYVFEYDLFATRAGDFSDGPATLQCMYAPEFTAHSEGTRLKVEF
jgi:uncharacterized protein YfaS (alpha-2-macroglobulin family)